METKIAKVQLIDFDLLEITIQKDKELEKSDALDILKAAEELGGGRRLKHIFILGNRTLYSQEARVFSSSTYGSRFKLAEAFVATTISQRLILNFMINVEGTTAPSKLFSNRDKATAWLKEQ